MTSWPSQLLLLLLLLLGQLLEDSEVQRFLVCSDITPSSVSPESQQSEHQLLHWITTSNNITAGGNKTHLKTRKSNFRFIFTSLFVFSGVDAADRSTFTDTRPSIFGLWIVVCPACVHVRFWLCVFACVCLCTHKRTPAAWHAATRRRPTDLLLSQVCVFAAGSGHNQQIQRRFLRWLSQKHSKIHPFQLWQETDIVSPVFKDTPSNQMEKKQAYGFQYGPLFQKSHLILPHGACWVISHCATVTTVTSRTHQPIRTRRDTATHKTLFWWLSGL